MQGFLPGTPYVMGSDAWPPIQQCIDEELPWTLATDFNPNCQSLSIPMAGSLVTHRLKIDPIASLAAVTRNSACGLNNADRLQGVIAEGAIGKIYGLEMHLVADQTRLTNKSYQAQWYTRKKRAGGGHLVWLGIHWLDLAQFVTGAEITEVAGFIANVGGQPIDIEDSATATLRFDNGALGTMTSGYYLKRGYHSHIKIWGSEGWLHLQQMLDKPLHWVSQKGAQAGKVQEWKGNRQPRGYTPYVRACIEACANDTDPPINNADSLRAIKVVYSIYEAAGKGKTIRID